MDSIVITDIYSNNITDDKDTNNLLPFIIINTKPSLLLEKVQSYRTNNPDSTWKINLKKLFTVLYTHNINPNNFAPLGDLWFPTQNLPPNINILLVNGDSRISSFPTNFVSIDDSVWKPVCPSGFNEIGLIFSPTKPSLRSMKVINKKYLIKYNKLNTVIDKKTTMNEFNFLSLIGIDKFTINRELFYGDNNKHTDDDSVWKTQEGKNVVLIQPSVPWYINKHKDTHEHDTANNNTQYHDYANFNSNFIADPSKPDLGYGYSVAQRHEQSCQCIECNDKTIEPFNTPNRITLNTFIITLLSVILTLIIVRKYFM